MRRPNGGNVEMGKAGFKSLITRHASVAVTITEYEADLLH